jgi:tetratricopeptide (TPR) repeat protein
VLDTGAWIYYRKGDYEKARDLLITASSKGKEIPEVNYHLGMVYLQFGEREKAREYLSLAVNSKAGFSGLDKAKKALSELNKSM